MKKKMLVWCDSHLHRNFCNTKPSPSVLLKTINHDNSKLKPSTVQFRIVVQKTLAKIDDDMLKHY
uniref:Uncharacterized protein n=1 Tax=Daphnia galeata TaxID=27404 RepID=A0A8J2RPN2_9CRUS|nr:unnamed protein product [Daphnia galeata]